MELKIWELRHIKNLTVEELVELSGVSRATIYRLEGGKIPQALQELEDIAKALGCDIKDLLR